MDVLRFFKNYWQNISPRETRKIKFFALMMLFLGLLAGGLNAGLIGMINKILNVTDTVPNAYLWIFVGLLVLLPFAKYFSDVTTNRLFVPIQTDLMRNFMRKFMTLPLREIEKNGIAKYHAALSEDIRTLFGALRSLVFIGMHGTIVICCLLYLAWLSPPVFGWTFLVLGLGMTCHRLILIKAMRYLAIGREGYGQELIYFQSVAEGIKELKLHRERRNAFFETMVEPTFIKMTRNLLTGHNIFAVGAGLSAILYFVLMGSLLFGSMLLFNVEQEVLSGYALAVMFMFGPIEILINNANAVYRAKVSVAKMKEVGFHLAMQANEGVFYTDTELLPPWQEIRLEDLTFHFGDPETEPGRHDFVLGPVSLRIRPGEVVIVAGGNGSGKTTLAKVLAGLYVPNSGNLYYNDILIDESNRDRYRQIFSAVFVDFYLFNELVGLEHVADLDEKAGKYLEELEIGDKLNVTDGKLSTTELSQGQRKRLALMVTYLEDRPFYIFDEWTAHQDPVFRDFFYREILPTLKKRGKSVIVITHDDKYFHSGDRIIKLDMGKLDLDISSSMLKGKTPLELSGYPGIDS